MSSQPGKEIIAITICPISQEAKAIKIGQLLECNMRNIFLGKSNIKFGGVKLFPGPFLKNQN